MTNGWTSDKPTEEGWYWLRYKNNTRPSVHQVVRDDDGDGKGRRLWVVLGEDSRMPVATYDEQYTWIGPITPGDRAAGRVEGLMEGVWPNVIAPAMYDNPDPGWEDTRVPNLTRIWQLAREVGYAVGLHGSLKRDVDLIAAPWTDQAVGNAALIDHLCAGLPAARTSGPEHKPHGRVAVTLQIDGYFKPIDLSIAPRIDVRIEQAAQGGGGSKGEPHIY